MIHHAVTPADPHAHRFEVECRIDKPAAGGQVVRLPAWIRGSYRIREFSRHVVRLRAISGDNEVAVARLDKNRWRCAPCRGPLTLRATIHAFDDSVRKAYLDDRRGFFNGSSLLLSVEGQDDAHAELTVHPPPGDFGDWRAVSSMTELDTDARGFGTYVASGYEELIDHPFVLGTFRRHDFEVDHIPHALVLTGAPEFDTARLVRDVARICGVQREMFGGEPRLERYVFALNVTERGYGGLEHRASSALVCSRHELPQPGNPAVSREYRQLLGLFSHEYFHQWNVKRITAAAFAGSDLSQEAYTRDLWCYEGVTSYYDDAMLRRAGLLDAAAWLDVVAENATRLERTPGRRQQSLADASFDAWIKHYQPDDNTPNAAVSYYVKGALVALLLDLTLRRDTPVSLDDVMRALWERHGRDGRPVPEGGLEAIASDLAGRDLSDWFDAVVRGTGDLPLVGMLAHFGVNADRRCAAGDLDPGGRLAATPRGASLGLRLHNGSTTIASVRDGGPAQQAGLSGGDQVVALDGWRLRPGQWPARAMAFIEGRRYRVDYFRQDELRHANVVAEALPEDTWTIVLADADDKTLARRKAWLGA